MPTLPGPTPQANTAAAKVAAWQEQQKQQQINAALSTAEGRDQAFGVPADPNADGRFGAPGGKTARVLDTIAGLPMNAVKSLATLPQRAIEGAAQYRAGSGDVASADRAVAPAAETALNMMGMGSAFPAEANSLRMGIKAYHGSPHDFDKFEWSPRTIGTGEGAQVYGHGLYFAESPGVAKSYKEALSQGRRVGGESLDASVQALKDVNGFDGPVRVHSIMKTDRSEIWMVHGVEKPGGVFRKAQERTLGTVEKPASGEFFPHSDQYWQQLLKPGKTYEVDIKAHPDEFLNWDKPLNEQSAAVQKAIKPFAEKFGMVNADGSLAGWADGETFANHLESEHPVTTTGGSQTNPALQYPVTYNDSAAAAATLRDAGIKGIRYLDQGSRKVGAGTSNYVVFDAKTIEILKKYGIAGLTAGGAGAAMMNGKGGQAQAASILSGAIKSSK